MIKLKGATTVLGIILVSAGGWAALVTFVLAPNIWIGAALSFAGGLAIGVAVAFLMRRWWFKGIKGRAKPSVTTNPATEVGQTSATLNGELADD